ncbi:MAG: DUF1499 domain-containing protein [Rhizobiaceae bacterium]
MKIIRFIIKAGSILAIAGVIAFASLTFYGWERVWTSAFGPPDLGQVTFEKFAKGPKPNQALICPQDLCDEESLDRESSVYDIPAGQLRDELLKSLDEEDDLRRVDDGADPLKLRFIQRTTWMHYPDTIRVEIIPIDDDTSTLAIYSQSQIGESDFGVNLERVERWLSRLQRYE